MVFSLFFMPLNKPLTSIFLFLALIFSVTGKNFFDRLKAAIREPVSKFCLVWFFILTAYALHEARNAESWSELNVLKVFIYPLIASTLLTSNVWRQRGLLAFFSAVLLILTISWAQFIEFFILHNGAVLNPNNQYTVAKDYSQQALMTLVFFSLAMAFSRHDNFKKYKTILWIVAFLAIVNVLLVLQSRTAYVVAVPLLIFWLYQILKKTKIVVKTTVLLLIIFIALGFSFSPRVQHRIQEAKNDVTLYMSNKSATSVGVRFELWKRSIPMIRSAPIFGHGLGQWRNQYELQTKDIINFDGFRMKHPHQESLWILSEQGIVGYLIFILLLFCFFRRTRHFSEEDKNFYRSLLIIYVFFGLANCVLLDFSHRHLFLLLLCCVPLSLKISPATTSAKKHEQV